MPIKQTENGLTVKFFLFLKDLKKYKYIICYCIYLNCVREHNVVQSYIRSAALGQLLGQWWYHSSPISQDSISDTHRAFVDDIQRKILRAFAWFLLYLTRAFSYFLLTLITVSSEKNCFISKYVLKIIPQIYLLIWNSSRKYVNVYSF